MVGRFIVGILLLCYYYNDLSLLLQYYNNTILNIYIKLLINTCSFTKE
jgi:hypothetical protein